MHNAIFDTWTLSQLDNNKNEVILPDGCSLHLTTEDYVEYTIEYWTEINKKNNNSNKAPEKYSREDIELKKAMISDELFFKLHDKNGIRLTQEEYLENLNNNKLILI